MSLFEIIPAFVHSYAAEDILFHTMQNISMIQERYFYALHKCHRNEAIASNMCSEEPCTVKERYDPFSNKKIMECFYCNESRNEDYKKIYKEYEVINKEKIAQYKENLIKRLVWQ